MEFKKILEILFIRRGLNFIMMNNNFKKTTRGDVWEKTILSKTAKERLWRHKSYKKTIDKSLCRLGFNPRNKTVLEIGCSDGALSRFLFPKSCNIGC